MTLKTFHFAGVASMNVTMGVPRIKEIINAAKTISTALMNVALQVDSNEVSARIVKGRLEKATLKDIAKCIKLSITEHKPCILVTLDIETIHKLNLNINAATVRFALHTFHACASKFLLSCTLLLFYFLVCESKHSEPQDKLQKNT